jgi:hypothetical protein
MPRPDAPRHTWCLTIRRRNADDDAAAASSWLGRKGRAGQGTSADVGQSDKLGIEGMHHACSSPLLVAGLDLTQLGGHRLRLVDMGEARGQEVSGGCSAHRAHNAS